ncbi:hypothetical protein J1P26_07300 [Neobacillus sp. MM2021_6]|uniref:hypothetical protein n=1 Tax=Bacillaceae TaxID=186817 RepID=UPI00140AD383|nr:MULTISPECIES: hypothetical protein [Bacillaceae]MBO0959538.1 hypothetical protein [Neobacillus sp. MM2021_6]NHC17164.1 hypothetical protein [Bacillus sp. MM2020_4]
MYRSGDWIIESAHGLTGTVLHVWPDGVTARFGGMTAIRANHQIRLAPLDIQQEDLLAMQHLAVETGDEEWFREIGERLGVGVNG